MFKLHGETAYKKAYLLGHSNGMGRVFDVRERLTGSPAVTVHSSVGISRRDYPIELSELSYSIPNLPADRPLWMLHFDRQVVFATFDGSENNNEPHGVFGEEVSFLEVTEKPIDIEEIKIVDAIDQGQGPRQVVSTSTVPVDFLSLFQRVQLLSRFSGEYPRTIELNFVTLVQEKRVGLYADITERSGRKTPFFLCNNVQKGYISYPFVPTEFSRIKFVQNEVLYPTLFCMDARSSRA